MQGAPAHRLFAKFAVLAGHRTAGPILRIYPLTHVAMKRRMRPLRRARYVTVLHRVVMHVIDVPRQILLVADEMFPEPPLPKCRFAPLDARLRRWNPVVDPVRAAAGYVLLDQRPAQGKIVITVRQGPYAMQMIRQHNPGENPEWVRSADRIDGRSQRGHATRIGQDRPISPIRDSREIGAARDVCATIIRHGMIFPLTWCASAPYQRNNARSAPASTSVLVRPASPSAPLLQTLS